MVKNLAGLEWAARFCADPKKVDVLRVDAQRLYKGFPNSAKAFAALGFTSFQSILDTPITDAAGVATRTDSQGQPAAVVPASMDPKDQSARVVYATPGTKLHAEHQQMIEAGRDLIKPADDPMAQAAFGQRTRNKAVAAHEQALRKTPRAAAKQRAKKT